MPVPGVALSDSDGRLGSFFSSLSPDCAGTDTLGHEQDRRRAERHGRSRARHVKCHPTARDCRGQACIMCAMTDGQKSKPMDVFAGDPRVGGYRSCDRHGVRRGGIGSCCGDGRRQPAARSIAQSPRRSSPASSSKRSHADRRSRRIARGGLPRSVSAVQSEFTVDRARRVGAAIGHRRAAEEDCAHRVSALMACSNRRR